MGMPPLNGYLLLSHVQREGGTCSRKVRDLLMCTASLAEAPCTPDLLSLSDPARSTRFSLDDMALPSAHHTQPSHSLS